MRSNSNKAPKPLTKTHKDLIRRYLIWAYKSTKESFDRQERKTTQLLADDFIAQALARKSGQASSSNEEYAALVVEFKAYVAKKREQPVSAGRHAYMKDRLEAVEGAIKYFLGTQELNKVRAAYEAEFTRRIWESKDH